MRALVFHGPHRQWIEQIPRPTPAEGEVLIRVKSAAICGTDVRIVSGRKTRDVRTGHTIGHECAGIVAAVGKHVTDYAPGQRIAVCVVVSCGDCEYCLADKENLCKTRITLGYHTDGAFADYMLIPAHAVRRGNLFRLPETVSIELAPLLEPMACCLNGQHEMSLARTNREGTDALVIFGAGPIGLLHLLIAKARNIRTITVVEPNAHRRHQALRFGADAATTPDQFDAVGAFDAAILAVGVPELVNVAMRSVKPGGKVNFFAGFDKDARTAIDPNLIHYHQIRLTGASESRRRDYAEALSMVSDGIVDPSSLITHRFDLEHHEEAFRVASDGTALKVVFDL